MQHLQAPQAVEVSAPARLHLGFLDLNGEIGRRYGSIGLAIDGPTTNLKISRAQIDSVAGLEQPRTRAALAQLKTVLGLSANYQVVVKQAIPAHAGLGSGTQLALALGTGLTQLEGLKKSPTQLGTILDRGARSAIGMAAFDTGGFIVDGGRGTNTKIPPVLVSLPFPENWRALLVLDPASQSVHGEKEASAFANLPPMSMANVHRICHLTLMRMLPAIAEMNIATFGSAISEIQTLVGQHFADAQGGGIWSNPAIETLVTQLAHMGAHGIGQSSWGPTGFAFVSEPSEADQLFHSLVQDAKRVGLELKIAKPRNSGAKIRLIAKSESTTN